MDPDIDANLPLIYSAINDGEYPTEDMPINQIPYCPEDNYYKLWWQIYIKNEMLLKEYAEIINEKEEAKKKIVKIKVPPSTEILRRRHQLPNKCAQRKEKASEAMLQGNKQNIHMPIH